MGYPKVLKKAVTAVIFILDRGGILLVVFPAIVLVKTREVIPGYGKKKGGLVGFFVSHNIIKVFGWRLGKTNFDKTK